MLSIIGLGLDIGDISLKGLDAIKEADSVLIEIYTLPLPSGYIEMLEKETGKKITKIDRKALEEEVGETVAPSAVSDIALLVPGDPLVATTHHIIIAAARNAGAEIRIIHSASIFTASAKFISAGIIRAVLFEESLFSRRSSLMSPIPA